VLRATEVQSKAESVSCTILSNKRLKHSLQVRIYFPFVSSIVDVKRPSRMER